MHKAGKMMAVVTKKGADLVLIPQFGSLELRTNCESTTRTTTRKSLPVIDDVSSGYNGQKSKQIAKNSGGKYIMQRLFYLSFDAVDSFAYMHAHVEFWMKYTFRYKWTTNIPKDTQTFIYAYGMPVIILTPSLCGRNTVHYLDLNFSHFLWAFFVLCLNIWLIYRELNLLFNMMIRRNEERQKKSLDIQMFRKINESRQQGEMITASNSRSKKHAKSNCPYYAFNKRMYTISM